MPAPHDSRRQADAMMAVAIMIAACALLAAITLMAKMLGPMAGPDALHPLQVSAGRFAFATLALAPIILWLRPSFAGARWRNHLARVLFGWLGVSGLFAASGMMRLADANAISFTNPVFAMILSIPLLGEKVGPWRWGAAGLALIGALVLAQPGTDAFQPAAFIALAAAFFMGAEAILIKKLADSEPPLRILAINNPSGAVLSIAAATLVWKWPLPSQWLLLGAIGVTMLTVQALFIQAMRRGDASFVMPFFYTTLIFAGIYDYAVFGEIPTLAAWMGSGLIVAGAATIAWRERLRR